MQNATVDITVEISNLTADALEEIGKSVEKTVDQVGAFLLTKGFSNLWRANDASLGAASFRQEVLATQG